MSNVLSTSSLLSHVAISIWSARRLDKDVTAKVNNDHSASADAGRYNKSLIARDNIASITRLSGEARTLHYSMTLPWLDDGARILPAKSFLAYQSKMDGLKMKFDSAVADFVANYPAYVQDAKARLNGMFRADDYPDAKEIARKFCFAVKVRPMPDKADFRVSIPESALATLRADMEAQQADAMAEAMRDIWRRISEKVGAMAERLTAYKPAQGASPAEGVFRDSLVQNVADLVEVLPDLNLTGDPAIADAIERMRKLAAHDPARLRDADSIRRNVARQAQELADIAADYLA